MYPHAGYLNTSCKNRKLKFQLKALSIEIKSNKEKEKYTVNFEYQITEDFIRY